MVELRCRMGHGRQAREAIGSKMRLFGDFDEISQFAPVHTICQRQQEIITKGTHLQPLVTNMWLQDTPWIQAVLVQGIQEQLWAREIIEDASTPWT